MNNSQRQSRWGGATAAAATPHPPHPGGGAGAGGGGGGPPPPSSQRHRSQSWNDPRQPPRGGGNNNNNSNSNNGHRGYDTMDAPPPRGYGNRRDESRGRWGDRDNDDRRRDSGGGGGGQGQYSRYDNERREDWRCMECGSYNDPRDERCHNCGEWAKQSTRGGGGRRGGSPPGDGRRASLDDRDRYRSDRKRDSVDDTDGHYGPPRGGGGGDRRSRDSYDRRDDDRGGPRNKKSRQEQPKKREWPPPFDQSGASFIFDARSGMFYEPSSDFFYDPKAKLYYSNKKQSYFRYNDAMKLFLKVGAGGGNGANTDGGQQQGVAGAAGQVVGEGGVAANEAGTMVEGSTESPPAPNHATDANPEKAEPKQKIAISLKTPVPPKEGNGTQISLNEAAAAEKTKLIRESTARRKESLESHQNNHDPAAALSQSHKKHAKNLDKWSERTKEMREEDVMNDDGTCKKVKTTAGGQPICVVCRRKFANLEKLRRHEKLSALHKENLAKRAAAKEESASYRDRSKERRLMHRGGSDVQPNSSHAEALLAHALHGSSSAANAENSAAAGTTVRPEETLNAPSNVGNKLLQKLGWKSGEALGRDSAAAEDGAANGNVARNLKSDWERIESLAQRGGRR